MLIGRIDPSASPTASPAARNALGSLDSPVVSSNSKCHRLDGLGAHRIVQDNCLRCRKIPGHPWDEKGLQRRKSDGLLVSIQERGALLVPLMNRLSTADFVSRSVCIGFRLFVLLKSRSEQVCSMPWSWRSVFPGHTLPRRSAVRRRGSLCIEPPIIFSGFRLEILFSDILGMRMVCKDRKASVYYRASRNEERFSSR